MSILGEWAYYLLVFLSGLMLSKKMFLEKMRRVKHITED